MYYAASGEVPARTRIGPYHVTGWVGAGGMGHVYRARDPRLERDVAIKLLKPEAVGDVHRQRRLLAEGRAASALNHPNILTVYDADFEGDSYYLVTELIDGRPLRDELLRGPLPIRRLLDIAVQIADGLAAAHAAGIVHRDLKPENVMLLRDGRAKIVDFGLAAPGGDDIAPATATTTTVSIEGIRGTPAYMSPEQARGTNADFRSDQFSFGIVLYEMATGVCPFKRATVAETLSAVLLEEPAPLAQVNAKTPPLLRWMVERCLAKEPEHRYAATQDLARELQWLRDRLPDLADAKAIEGDTRHWRRYAVLPAAVAVAVALAAAALLVGRASSGAELGAYRFRPVAVAGEYEGAPAWSPDGQTLAYVGDVNGVLQVFTRRIDAAVSNQVTFGLFDADEAFWAPDGQRIFYISQAGEETGLWVVGAAGGRPELLLENVRHAAIDAAGRRLALLRVDETVETQRLWWAAPDGASLRRETRPPLDAPDGFGLNGALRFSPDGKELLLWTFSASRADAPERPSRFYLVPVGHGSPREVLTAIDGLSNQMSFDWLPDSRHIVVSIPDRRGTRHLWLADTRADAVRSITATHTNEAFPAVSRDGRRIAYASDEVDFDLVLIAPDGRTHRPVLATARNELDPAWAPGGDQVAFVTDRSGALEIWLRSRDGQWERPLVTQKDFGDDETLALGGLSFSPDGRRIAYQRAGRRSFRIWVSPVGGGPPVGVAEGEVFQGSPTWSPDGEWLAYSGHNGRSLSVNKIRVGDKTPVVLLDQGFEYPVNAWSPDGKWIAVKGPDALLRIPAAGGAAEPLSQGIVHAFTWAPDNRSLFVLQDAETPGHFALARLDAASGEEHVVNPDLGPVPIASQPIRGMSFLADVGFLTSFARARSDIWVLEGFARPRGWFERWFPGRPAEY